MASAQDRADVKEWLNGEHVRERVACLEKFATESGVGDLETLGELNSSAGLAFSGCSPAEIRYVAKFLELSADFIEWRMVSR